MLNPEQLFIVSTVSRQDLCDEINHCLDEGDYLEPMPPEDDRLTDELCQKYADGLHKISINHAYDRCERAQDEAQLELVARLAACLTKST